MINLNDYWDNIDLNNRHIIKGLTKEKIKRHINNFKNLYINHIDINKVNSSLDWGCGGGLLSKELKKISNKVYCVDISKHSIESCKKYAKPTEIFLLEDNILDIELPQVDLILANAIVWHFPTYEYFKNVVDKWVTLNPKYIAFNSKKSNKTTETNNYKNEFLNALFLKDKDVIELFKSKNYLLKSKVVPKNTVKPSTYFVFQKL